MGGLYLSMLHLASGSVVFFFFKLQQLELSDQDSFQFLNKNDSFLKRLDAFILKGKFICE